MCLGTAGHLSWTTLGALLLLAIHSELTPQTLLVLQQLVSLLLGGNLKVSWSDFTNPRFWPPSYVCFHSCHVGDASILMAQPLDLISVLCFLVSADSVFSEVTDLQ